MDPEALTESESRDVSHDKDATPPEEDPTFQQVLSTAIRVSLSGEEIGNLNGEGEEEEEENFVPHTFQEPAVELRIPDDLPVDIRVKLAVCMIHLSLPLPPSLLPPVVSQPEEYGDLFIDLAEAYSENGQPFFFLFFLFIVTI